MNYLIRLAKAGDFMYHSVRLWDSGNRNYPRTYSHQRVCTICWSFGGNAVWLYNVPVLHLTPVKIQPRTTSNHQLGQVESGGFVFVCWGNITQIRLCMTRDYPDCGERFHLNRMSCREKNRGRELDAKCTSQFIE